jgi:succinate semialdehyde reductase (NADPH)
MRAAVLETPNSPLQIEELADPSPKAGEVLVRTSVCGVCHTDLHVIKGELTFPTPAVLGHEISGVVEAVGIGVNNARVGDRVVASFIMPCGWCRYCVRGNDDLCETFFSFNRLSGTLYDGATRIFRTDGTPLSMYSMGGLAEMCVVPATDVFPIPDALDLRDVATLGCSMLTAYGATHNVAELRPGNSVAVVAVGGVGSAIIQLAQVHGASKIIVIDVAKEKLDAALQLGATHAVNGLTDDVTAAVMEITKGQGVDVAFEALGSPATFAAASSIVGDGGAVVVVGIAPAGTPGAVDLSRLPRRKLRILGSYGGRPRADMPAIIDLVTRGVLKPQSITSRRFSLDETDLAYQSLDRGEIVGRAVIDIGPA